MIADIRTDIRANAHVDHIRFVFSVHKDVLKGNKVASS